MQKEIIEKIAAYLEKNCNGSGYFINFQSYPECWDEYVAAEIAAAIAPCFDMLQNACEEVVKGYEGDGLENISTRDKVFYRLCKEALEPLIVCPDCNGSGGVEIGEKEYTTCPCVAPMVEPEKPDWNDVPE